MGPCGRVRAWRPQLAGPALTREGDTPSSAPTVNDEQEERTPPINEEAPTETGATPGREHWGPGVLVETPAPLTPSWAHVDPTTIPPEVPLPGSKAPHPVYVWLEDHGLLHQRHGARLDRLEFVVVVLVGVAVGAFTGGMLVSAVLVWTVLQVLGR